MKMSSIQMLKNYFGVHEGNKKIFEEAEKMHEEEIKKSFFSGQFYNKRGQFYNKHFNSEFYFNEEFKNEKL